LKHTFAFLQNDLELTETFANFSDVNFMSKSPELSNPRLDHILHTLIERRKLWLIPGCVALLTSWVYCYFIRSESYTARQTLIVRDDLLGQSLKPGQFESLDLMKSAQETILEIARKPQVVRNAMKTIGPARPGWFGVSASWPDDETIEEVQGSIELSAPNGAEFGHTETVHLTTKSSSRERAAEFVLALLDEINVKLNEVRDLKLQSMTDELTLIRDSARESLSDSAARLSKMEREIGPDLPTLRALSDPQSGEGAMSQTLLQIRSERRQFENRLHSAQNQRKTLIAATHDPNAILATSDELFSFQPALSRLKQELIEAQSALAESVGRYEQAHPQVQKQQEQVRSMHRQIHLELDSAKRGLKGQIASLTQKVEKSLAQEAEIDNRFNRISSKRVTYLGLDEEVKKKSEVFNEAQGHLAAVQRLGSSEFDVTLLTPVDEPQVSTRADGLGAKTTILGSGLAGILAGFGLVLLLDPGPQGKESDSENPKINPQRQPNSFTPVAETPAAPAPPPAASASPPVAETPTAQAPTSTANVAPAPPALVKQPAPIPVSVTDSVQKVVDPKPNPSVAQASPTPSETPTEPAVVVSKPDRSVEIQGLIDSAVAQGAGKTSAPAVEVKPIAPPVEAPVQGQVNAAVQSVTNSPEIAQPSPTATDKNAAEVTRVVEAARRKSVSTGVPTAASILAAMKTLDSPADTSAETVIQPQQTDVTGAAKFQNTAAQPAQNVVRPEAPTEPLGNTLGIPGSNELELQRRANQIQPEPLTGQAAPFVTLEPNASNASDSGRSANPFLTPEKTSREGPTPTAQRMLEEARAEAERKGMVAPVVPNPSDETSPASRIPASTVPIPEQIKQLTDSIASFAKPIQRVEQPSKSSDF